MGFGAGTASVRSGVLLQFGPCYCEVSLGAAPSWPRGGGRLERIADRMNTENWGKSHKPMFQEEMLADGRTCGAGTEQPRGPTGEGERGDNGSPSKDQRGTPSMKLIPRRESPTEWGWGSRPRGSGRGSGRVQKCSRGGIPTRMELLRRGVPRSSEGIMGAQLAGRAGPDCKIELLTIVHLGT